MTAPAAAVATVQQLWRYPVKSLVGEELAAAEVDRRGLRGDRSWALHDADGRIGSGKSTRRFRRMDGLLMLRAAYDGDVPVLRLPDGRVLRGAGPATDAALSAYVGRPVSLAPEGEVPHHDDGPVHLVTTSGLRAVADAHGAAVDVRHFRPNVVLDTGEEAGFPEDGWLGRTLEVGDALLEVVAPMPRCVMVTMAQVGLDGDAGLLGTVTDRHGMDFGVLAEVRRPGRLGIGDAVRTIPA